MCKRRDSQQYLKDIDTATVTTRIVQHYRTDHGKRKLIPINDAEGSMHDHNAYLPQ
jgi:hypothetical protein